MCGCRNDFVARDWSHTRPPPVVLSFIGGVVPRKPRTLVFVHPVKGRNIIKLSEGIILYRLSILICLFYSKCQFPYFLVGLVRRNRSNYFFLPTGHLSWYATDNKPRVLPTRGYY